MPETHPRESMHDVATEALSEFSRSVPAEFRSHLTAITTSMSRARAAADAQGERMARMYGDPTYERPVNHREVSQDAQRTAEEAVDKHLSAADQGITALEAELRRSALPPAPSSSSDRIAARQEIDVVLGDARSMQALTALEALTASTNPHVLGEIVSEYGQNLMQARGVAPEGIERVTRYVIEAVAAGRTKDRRRQQAAKALLDLNHLKVANTATSGAVRGKLRRLKSEHDL